MLRSISSQKDFLRQFALIALPIAGQNFINFAVSMMDTLMIGQLGEVQLAAVNQANQLSFVMTLLVFGVGSGANVMIAQYWGKGDTESIRRVLTIAYRLLAAVVLLFTSLALFCPYQVMSVFSNSPEVIEVGAGFLRIVGIGYLFNCFATVTIVVFRSMGTVKISLVVYLASLVINTFLNWVLIFGNLGAPALGVTGGAIATVAARVAELIIVAVFLLRFEKNIGYRLHMVFRQKVGKLGDFFRHALPVILNELLWGMGSAAITAIIGWMGTEFNAAYTICAVLSQLVSIAFNGAGSASAVVIGNTVGAGEYKLAKTRANLLLAISATLGVIAMGLVFLIKGPFLSLYKVSDLAREYAAQIMTVHAFIVWFQSMSMVAVVGVLRGGGDGRFAAVVDVSTIWLVAIPLGFLSGHIWGWPVPAVYAMIKIDDVLKTILTLPRLLKGGWVKDVTRGSM